MSITNFIPEMWSDKLLPAVRKNLVFGSLYNRDYEGEIKQMGDTVKINAIGDITVTNYVKDTDLTAPQALTDAQTMLVINQAKYYNFEVDDVDQAQAAGNVMSEAMSWAGYKIALGMDQFLAGFYTDAPSANTIGTSGAPLTVTAPTQANAGIGTTAYDYIVVLGQYLTQSAVPLQGRWCVIPPWVKTYLTQDIRFTSFNTAQARMTIETGKLSDASGGMAGDAYLGRIEGMDVYESLNAPHIGGTVGIAGSQDAVIAGHRFAVTMAEGLVKTEAYRPPYRFSDAVKGLALYGAKTVRPYGLAVAYLQHP